MPPRHAGRHPREREVVRLYFGIGREHGQSLAEIGDRVDLTRERVRQIKEAGLYKLRHRHCGEYLRTHVR